MNRPHNKGIATRLILAFLLFCLLLVGIGLFTTNSARNVIIEGVSEHTDYLAQKLITDFDYEVNRKARMLHLYAQGANLYKGDFTKEEIVQDLIVSLEREYGIRIFNRALITDASGNVLLDTSDEMTGNKSDQMWWANTQRYGFYEDRTILASDGMNVFFPLSVPFYDDENRFAGVLRVDVNLNMLTQQAVATNLPHASTKVRLINSEGQLLYSSRPYIPMTNISESGLFTQITENENGSFFFKENNLNLLFGVSKLASAQRALDWYLIIDTQQDEVLAPARVLLESNLFTLAMVTLIGIILAIIISGSITKPLALLKNVVEQVGPERLALRTGIRRNDEVGKIAESFDSMMELLEVQTNSLKQQNWIETGQNSIGKTMRKQSEISDLCTDVLTSAASYLGAAIGACYLHNEGVLTRMSTYAFIAGKDTPESFRIGEGFAGQAATEKKMKVIETFPENYIFIGSAVGTGSPSSLIEVPVLLNDELKGVMELGFTTPLPDFFEELLSAVTRDLAVTLDALQKAEIERQLLQKTEEQKQELLSQQEELRVTNEELEEQTERLRLSEDNLKQQQAELEEVNSELEEKNVTLKEKQMIVEQSQKELLAKAEELNRESRYKSEFLSNMSHELRTPLNSLLLLSQDLMSNEPKNLNAEQIESAEIIYNGGKDLLSLINQILDMSKIEAGKMELHPDSFTVENFRSVLTNTFALQAKKKGIEFTIDMDTNTPEKIVTDVMRVEQILRNLVSNAIKFTSDGGVSVQFSGDESEGREMLNILVSDTGIGIPSDQQSEIFSAFHQGDSGTSRRFGGTGLGLTITKELVGLLGGTISLASTEGEGTSFTVRLPVQMTEAVSEVPEKEKAEPAIPVKSESEPPMMSSAPESLSDSYTPPVADDRDSLKEGVKTILVIEDDVRFLSTVMKQCKARGYNCIGEATGQRGLKSVRTFKPDGIILDLHLPEMDGYEVLEQLKNDTEVRHIPVHIMSVDDPSLKVYKQGAMGFLTKPVSRKSLDDALNKLISYSESETKRILIVEDDEVTRKNLEKLLRDTHILVDTIGTGAEALTLIQEDVYNCIVLDLGLPDMDGYKVIEKLQELKGEKDIPPVIIYTGHDVSEQDLLKLEESPQSVILKDVHSEERLLDEVTLFLHQVVGSLDPKKRQVIADLHNPDSAIAGHRILVVDDDMRALFAVAKTLSRHGLQVVKAESGKKALSLIESDIDFDLILMDIMMPEMDGYETMKHIRNLDQGSKVPIIALTAKAMKGDREKCIASGANDYLAKPIDVDKLLSLIRVWLYR